jgi:hypothetical protein
MIGPADAPKPGAAPPKIDELVREATKLRRTAAHALRCGVNPDELLSYARGNKPHGFEAFLAQSPWAMGRVVALVKANRRPESLGAKLLRSPDRTDPYAWGIQNTGDREADLATLLDKVD